MSLNIEALRKLMKEREWNEPMLALKLGLHYTYLYRVFRNQRKSIYKFIVHLIVFCEKEGLDFRDYVIF